MRILACSSVERGSEGQEPAWGLSTAEPSLFGPFVGSTLPLAPRGQGLGGLYGNKLHLSPQAVGGCSFWEEEEQLLLTVYPSVHPSVLRGSERVLGAHLAAASVWVPRGHPIVKHGISFRGYLKVNASRMGWGKEFGWDFPWPGTAEPNFSSFSWLRLASA